MVDLLSFKRRLKNREKLFGAWISFDHPSISEIFALGGFDFISIDMEHAPISLESAQNIFSRVQAHGIPCLPRPVSHSNDIFKPLLDSGADGLVVQMVNNISELDQIVNCLKYPPIGGRTYGVNRAHDYGFSFEEYTSNWNNLSSLIVQIESKEGVENIHNILTNNAVDGVMIGPYDLSGSYGLPGQIDNPIVQKAADKVISACKEFNVSCGTQISEPDLESVEDAFKKGYTFVILGSDLFVLWKWSEKMKSLIYNLKTK